MSREQISDLLPGTNYQIQVRAVGADAVSEWSRVFDVTTIADTVPPKVPANVTWVVSGDSFHGEWDEVTQNTSNENIIIGRYEVELTAGATVRVTSVPMLASGRQVFDLSFEANRALFSTPQASVSFRVRAVDHKGLAGAWSASISRTNPAPAQPANPLATKQGVNAIVVTWDAPAETDLVGYNVYVGTSSGFTPAAGNRIYSGPATTYTYTTATQVAHYFKIRAVDKFGQESGAPDATTLGVTPDSPFTPDTTAPSTPTSLTGTITNNANGIGARVSLTWVMTSPPSDLAGYYVRYRKVGDTNWTVLSFAKDDLAGIIELQSAYQNYEFQIKAFDWMNNESAWSATVTVTSPANSAPAQVTGLISTAGRDSIVYKWSAVADTDIRDYEVTFSTSPTFASGNITYYTGTATTLTVGGLVPNTTYYARVRAVDTAGNTSASWSTTDTETTGQIVPTDGYPPASSPTPNVMSGLGNLYLTWAAVTTNSNGGTQLDPVTYEVHLSTSSGFTPSGATKVTEVDGLSAIVDVLPGTTTPLSYGTTYYIKIIARDRDGSAAASAQGSGQTSKVASSDVVSINADLIVNGTGFANALVVATGGSLSSANYVANTSGYRLSTSGLEINNGSVKASLLIGDTLTSSTGVIQIGSGASIIMNGGYLKSNTYTGTSEASNPSNAGFYLGNDGLRVDTGKISASTLNIGGTITSGNIVLGGTGTAGTIQTSGYNGTSGFRLSANGLEIPDGSLSVKKVVVKTGRNLLPAAFADFELQPTWYATNMFDNANALFEIKSDGTAYNNSQYVRHTRVGTAGGSDVYFGASITGYNFPVQEGVEYTYSVYLRGHPTTTFDVLIGVKWDTGALATTTVTVPAGSGWTRYNTTSKVAPTGATKAIGFHRLNNTTDALYYDFDAAMLEETTGGTPSVWAPPGSTLIDGNMIRTGEIRSNTSLTVNGITLPTWIIDTAGTAQFGNLLVRGAAVVGSDEAEASGSFIQSFNYVQGEQGWIVRSDGYAEFRQLAADSIDGAAIMANTLGVDTLTGGPLGGDITLADAGIYANGPVGEIVGFNEDGFVVKGAPQISVTSYSITSNVVTVTTSGVHDISVGNVVRFSNLTGTTTIQNDTLYTVTVVPSTTTFRFALTAADIGATSITGLVHGGGPGGAKTVPVLVNFPSDGASPNILSSTIETNSIVATDAVVQSDLHLQFGSTLRIASGVDNPTIAPTVSATLKKNNFSYPSGKNNIGNPKVTVGHDGNFYIASGRSFTAHVTNLTIMKYTRGVNDSGTSVYTSTLPDSNVVGMAYVEGFYWVLYAQHATVPSLSTTYKVMKFNTSFALQATYTLASHSGLSYTATLGVDHTNTDDLLLLYAINGGTSGTLKHFDIVSGVPTAGTADLSLTLPSTSDDGIAGVAKGVFDFAGTRIIVKMNSDKEYKVYSTAGAVQTNDQWRTYATSVDTFCYDTTAGLFAEMNDPTGIIWYNTGESVWSGTSSSTKKWWVGYTWYDSVGTTHQTSMSPFASVDILKRRWINVGVPDIPSSGGETPDQARTWSIQQTSQPANNAANLKVRATISYPNKSAYLDFVTTPTITGGSNTNTFAGVATPAQIVSTSGNSFWKGDDGARFYKLALASNEEATTAAGNKPALRIGNIDTNGDATGQHLRIDSDEINSMATDSTVGTLHLNSDGTTIVARNANGRVKIGNAGTAIGNVWTGSDNVTTSATGVGTFTHNLGISGAYVVIMQTRDNGVFRHFTVTAKNANNFTFRVENDAGATVNNATVNFDYIILDI